METAVLLCVLLLMVHAAAPVELSDYCKISKENTPCMYCTVHSRCGSFEPEYVPLKDSEKEIVLKAHNKYREEVAAGKHTGQHMQQASDMHVLSWDKETEFVAACYIKQCKFAHDKKRLTASGDGLGQNLYAQANSVFKLQINFHLENAVKLWFDEIKLLTGGNSKGLYTNFQMITGTGHLTQIVWGKTKMVGCCYKHFKEGKFYKFHVFCNYRPEGNVKTLKIYTPGAPNCSVKNDVYPHLCGKIRPMSADNFVVPYGAANFLHGGSFALGFAVVCSLVSLLGM